MSERPPDRRREERRPCRFKSYFRADESPLDCFWWHCLVCDISPHGCRLRMQRFLRAGTVLTLDLSIPNSPTSCELPVRVAHVEVESSNVYSLGCAFLRELRPNELEALRSVVDAHKGVWVQPTSDPSNEGERGAEAPRG